MKRKGIFLLLLLGLSLTLKSHTSVLNCSKARAKCFFYGYKYDSITPNDFELTDLITVVDLINDTAKWNDKEKKIKIIGYANIEEYKKDKKLAYKRAERISELMRYYGLDKSIELSIEEARVDLLESNDLSVKYQNRRVEVIILNGEFSIRYVNYLE